MDIEKGRKGNLPNTVNRPYATHAGYETDVQQNTGFEKVMIFGSYFLLIILFPLSLMACFMVLTKDSVTVSVDAAVYYRVREPISAVIRIVNYSGSTELLAQTTLRSELGKRCLAELLSEREAISHVMQTTLFEATGPWGVEVERVEIRDVRLPFQLQKAMAAEAEAIREAKAKIIVAEGEIKASTALKEASKIMFDNPVALQLRYLQTLTAISTSTSTNSTVIFPFPMEFLKAFFNGAGTRLQ